MPKGGRQVSSTASIPGTKCLCGMFWVKRLQPQIHVPLTILLQVTITFTIRTKFNFESSNPAHEMYTEWVLQGAIGKVQQLAND